MLRRVFGLKPTRGAPPWGPTTARSGHGLAIEHAISISVRDSAAMLDAIAGPGRRRSLRRAAPGAFCFDRTRRRSLAGLRIAFTAHPFLGHARILTA